MRTNLTFSKICGVLSIFFGMHLQSTAQCDCPGDTESPQFASPEWVTLESCGIADLPAPQFTDNCDADIEVTTTSEIISNEYYGMRSINSEACMYPVAWSLVLFNVPASLKYYKADGLGYRKYADNTIHIYGNVVSTNDALAGFTLDVWLYDGKSWTDWTSEGARGYKSDCNAVGANHESWTYYKVQEGSHAVGYGHLEGSMLNFFHTPVNFYYGFQEGVGANNTSEGFGLGGWVTYTGTYINSATGQNMAVGGSGDIVGESEACPSPQYELTHTATDDCGNSTIATQIIEVLDHTAPVLTNEPDNLEMLCAEFVNWEPVWEDNCSAVTIQMDADVYVAYDGCGNPDYLDPNFNVLPSFEDCEVWGCTDSDASNYNPDATLDDGSCFVQYINAYVFHDLNMNGTRQTNEPYLADALITRTFGNVMFSTDANGMVAMPYNSSNFNNNFVLNLASTGMAMASTPTSVSFNGQSPPLSIMFGVYNTTPSGAVLTTNSSIVGKLCGAGTFDILFGITNTGDISSTPSSIAIAFPSGVTVTNIGLANGVITGNSVTADVPAIAASQSISWLVTISISDTQLINGLDGIMTITTEYNNDGNVIVTEVMEDCGESGLAALSSNPAGEGTGHFIPSANPVLYTFQYLNPGPSTMTSFDLGIFMDAIFDINAFQVLVSNGSYDLTVYPSSRTAILSFDNLNIAPQSYLTVQYSLAAPNAVAGDELAHRVYYATTSGDTWSNEIVLHIADCPATLNISSDHDGCAGVAQLSIDNELFESVTWTSNDAYIATGGNIEVNVWEMGAYEYVVVAENDWCSVQDQVTINVMGQQPELAILGDNEMICGDQSVSLTAAAPNAYIEWFLDDVSIGQVETINAEVAGEYTAVAQDLAGCGSATSSITIEQLEIPEVNIAADGALEFCEGEQVVLEFSSNVETYEVTQDGAVMLANPMVVNTTSTIEITSENECGSDSETIEVVVNPLPVVDIMEGLDVLVFVTMAIGEYQWYYQGQPIVGETENFITCQMNGYYQVEVTNAEGCSAFSPELLQVYASVDEIQNNDLLIYPNPAKDVIWWTSRNAAAGTTFTIYNSLGQSVGITGTQTSKQTTIDVSGLSAGLYTLRLEDGSSKSFIVE
jgi:hypothetical protein